MKGGKVSSKELKEFISASYADKPAEKIGNYVLDKSMSKPTGVVYHNPATKDTKVVHRGTKGAADWANNAAYMAGMYKDTNRYKKGQRLQQRAEKRYGAENIDTIGHSQSGILSRELGKNTKNIINLNPAYLGERQSPNETVIRSSLDPVSAVYSPINYVKGLFGKQSQTHTIPATTLNPLTEHSSNILDRLPENTTFGGQLKISEKLKSNSITMNPSEFKEQMKHYKVILKKVKGHPLHQVMVDGLHESYHENRRAGKAHIVGAGFFKDMYKGVKTGVKIAKNVAPLVGLVTGKPETAAMAHTYLSAADQAMSGGRINFDQIRKGLKTAVRIGKVAAPIAGLMTGNPMLAAAAATGLSAADTALGGNMSGGYGRQMSGGTNLSGAGNMSGGKLVKGSPEAKAFMARLREMRRK